MRQASLIFARRAALSRKAAGRREEEQLLAANLAVVFLVFAVDEAFPDIAGLAGACRFRDCRHGGEPGCAGEAALPDGRLDRGRYESYLEYRREARHRRLMGDAAAQRKPAGGSSPAPPYSRKRKGGYSSVMSAT